MRLFVAVYPPPERVRELFAALEGVELPPHRLTSPEQAHMTLQFIGDRRERELDDVIESVERSAAGIEAFEVTPRTLISLPAQGAARLVAIETDTPPGLMEIQRRLAHRLADPKRRSRGKFRPHVTLCRFEREERMEAISRPVDVGSFSVGEIKLMKSLLRPSGPVHGTVHTVRLNEGAQR